MILTRCLWLCPTGGEGGQKSCLKEFGNVHAEFFWGYDGSFSLPLLSDEGSLRVSNE